MGSLGRDRGPVVLREGETSAAAGPSPEVSGGTTASMGLWPWVRLATQRGLPLEQYCELVGVEVCALRDLGQRFSQPVANRVAELAFARFGRGAAMEAALTFQPGHFQLLELIARSAPSVSAGLEQGCRFFALLHDGGRLGFERLDEGDIALRWRPKAGYEAHYGYIELTFAVAVIATRRETEQDALAPLRVHFRHAAPADAAPYKRLFGVTPRFGMDADEIVFDRRDATLPLARRSPEVHAAATKSGAELVED